MDMILRLSFFIANQEATAKPLAEFILYVHERLISSCCYMHLTIRLNGPFFKFPPPVGHGLILVNFYPLIRLLTLHFSHPLLLHSSRSCAMALPLRSECLVCCQGQRRSKEEEKTDFECVWGCKVQL